MADLPTGTITFLFTDIEGSTRLWEQHPQAMEGALARHDAIMRQAIAAAAGVVYKVIGDAFQAAFTTAPAACAAALAAQRALTSEAWGVVGAVPVRMALHTCAAVPEDGDYRSGALNRLGRLMGAVHGGQIVLSRSTADLARDTLPSDVTLRDLGERHLRDLRPEPIFQLVAPDLPSDFPPLKTLDLPAHNLPVPPTALIGREHAIAMVCAMLRRTEVRFVTLTGPGGMGKTRLALQTAAVLLEGFSDGVWFVNLAPISDPSLVAATIAQVLEVREAGGQPLIERLTEYLRSKQLLLVLDNFEQVVDAAPLIGALLTAAPHFKALVTSREPLHLAGEHEYAVPPLALPPQPPHPPTSPPRALRLSPTSGERAQTRGIDQTLPLSPAWERGMGGEGDLAQYAAIQLFLARAQAVKADFVVTSDSAPAIAAICQRLDGLPLAIELAAARVKLLPPPALLARLDQRLKLLTGGARDLPARQQTIRNTIDWSYHLLQPDEQALFRRLGVFVGGCTLAAAEAVSNADHDLTLEVLDGLAALVDKSLLKQAEGVAGEPRFTMLETIRAYALERLEEIGEADTVRRRHAEHFLALAETAEPQLHGPDQVVWLDYLEREHDNLRAVLTWSLATDDQQAIGLRVATGLAQFWLVHVHQREGIMWFDRLLSQPTTRFPIVRARALTVVGMLAENQTEFRRATTWLEQSLALYRTLDDPAGIAEALMYLGRCKYWQAAYAEALPLLLEALSQFKSQGDDRTTMWALISIGDCLFYSDSTLNAQAYFQKGLVLAQQREDPFGNAWAFTCLGRVALAMGDHHMAQFYLDRALPIFHDVGMTSDVAHVLLEQARVVEAQGLVTQALQYYAESLAVFARERLQRVPECLEGIAGLAAAHQPAQAAQLLGAASAIRESANVPLPLVYRASYERTVAAARAQLDEAIFASAWAAGRALSLEQAIAEALRIPSEVQPVQATVEIPESPSPDRVAPDHLSTLTPRERQVLALIAQGASNRVIADALVIAERTAEIHVSNILGKLGVTSRTQAAAYAVAHGLAAPTDA